MLTPAAISVNTSPSIYFTAYLLVMYGLGVLLILKHFLPSHCCMKASLLFELLVFQIF